MKEYTIDQYRDKMMEIAQKALPKESKRILATESQKLKRHLLKYAKQNVPVSEIDVPEHKKYHTHFKVGKTYSYNDALSKRVFNNSGHGKYVESGRPVVYGYRSGEKWGPKAYCERWGQGHARYYKPRYDPNKQRVYSVQRKSRHYDVYWHVKSDFDPVYKQDLMTWIDKMVNEGKL